MLPKCLGDKIEKVQKRALRIIYPTTDNEDALNIAQCKRLDDRRQELCAKTFKKILKPDAHLNHLLPPLREESHELDLRNNSNFTLTKCRTERFKTSFIPAMTANLIASLKDEHLRAATDYSRTVVRDAMNLRSKFKDVGNRETISRLEEVINSIDTSIVWHVKCFSLFTSKDKIQRLEKKCNKD
ncbi:Hypothetical predicted protein [Paramuricea clavata]|uniref:Uncharacterized protein n=1 Tax=Paramuricea clavata TaxID=317549 RepID=A0A7D9EUG6_PARCT|nr:Hypothetical predicted protein [Paramuricea clavata]